MSSKLPSASKRVDEAGLRHPAVGFVAPLLGAEAEVGHGAAVAAHAIAVAAIQARVLVEVVGVVGADLRGLVTGDGELRELGIRALDVHLQPDAHQPAEIAKAFGAIECVRRRFRAQDLIPRALQNLTELMPRLAGDDLLF